MEAHRVGSIRITRDHRRSLWLARAVTVTDRDTHLATARDNLTALRSTARGRAVTWVNEWDRLLGWPLHELLDALNYLVDVAVLTERPQTCEVPPAQTRRMLRFLQR